MFHFAQSCQTVRSAAKASANAVCMSLKQQHQLLQILILLGYLQVKLLAVTKHWEECEKSRQQQKSHVLVRGPVNRWLLNALRT